MKWHCLVVVVVLAAVVCTAACTDESTPAPEPEPRSPALPGQQMVMIGGVTGEGTHPGTIDFVTFRVGLVPGEASLNMENISIVYADAVRSETLTALPGLRGVPPQGSWGVLDVVNEEGINNRLEYDEQFLLELNPKAPLVPRQFITIVIRPPSGTPMTIRRVAPPSVLPGPNLLEPV